MDPDSGDLLLVAASDEAALRRLVARWGQTVYALFERTREPSAAADVAAEVFVELAQGAGTYRPGSPFADRLFRLVWRRLREQPALDRLPAVPPQRLNDSVGARTALLRAAVASLPPAERALFLFTHIAELPVADAARVVGIQEGEAKRLLVMAMDGLQRSLGSFLALVVSDSTTTRARVGGAA